MAAEAHALAHTLLWTSSRDYFPANGCPIEKDSTCHPVEWFYWTSSRTDDLGPCVAELFLFKSREVIFDFFTAYSAMKKNCY